MLAVSTTGAIAAVPLLPANTQKCPITIQFPATSTAPLSFELPQSYNEASKTTQHIYDWFIDPDAPVSAADDTNANLPQARAIAEKKANINNGIRGLAWSIDGTYLGIALDSYIFLLYSITTTTATLITTIGLPRHLGMVSMTPNGKNWLVVDTVGDVYGFSHSRVITGDQTHQQQFLYSVGTLCTQFQSINVSTSGKDYVINADAESKIRVGNLPNYFEIQSFCMGSRAPPTTLLQLQTQQSQPSNFIISACAGGYSRERISDPESGWCPYTPTIATISIHDVETGLLALPPYPIDNTDVWDAALTTQYSAATYYGMGALYQGNNTTVVYASPTLSTCKLDQRGHLDISSPISYRTTIDQLMAIEITVPTETIVDNAVVVNPVVTKTGITIDNLPTWFNSTTDQILRIYPTTNQTNFVIHTTTNKILIIEGKNGENVTQLQCINGYDFSATQTPLAADESFMNRYDTISYGVSKWINFHWRFERAPTRAAAQKRQHLASALRGGDEPAPGDLDDEADPNELVQLGAQ